MPAVVAMSKNSAAIAATAILDRLLHHCDVIAINGPSYRLKDRALSAVPAAVS